MSDLDYLAAIRENADVLADAADAAGVDVAVPSCPDWTVADLLDHIGVVHRWAAMCCDREPGGPFVSSRQAGIESPADPSARADWVREGAQPLVDTLAAHDPDDVCWTWAPPSTVGFWRRRQAHETAVHRVDAQLAAGAVTPIDAPLAADGIDEWLSLLPNMPWREDPAGSGATIHFHCTDVEGEWVATLAPTGLQVERTHAKADVAARGAASDLLCWVMGRGPIDGLEIFGDRSLLEGWRETAKF